MATGKKNKEIKTIGDLKKFIDDIPGETLIYGDFDEELVEAILWEADDDESGPREWFLIENI